MNPQWVSHYGAWCSEFSGFLQSDLYGTPTESPRYIYHERQLGGLCGVMLRRTPAIVVHVKNNHMSH